MIIFDDNFDVYSSFVNTKSSKMSFILSLCSIILSISYSSIPHNILSTIHADKASAIPYRLYSLMETDLDVNQFLNTIYRYVQLGVHVRARYDKETGKFMREVCEVCEFYVNEENIPEYNIIYRKNVDGSEIIKSPSSYLIDYLERQGVDLKKKELGIMQIRKKVRK